VDKAWRDTPIPAMTMDETNLWFTHLPALPYHFFQNSGADYVGRVIAVQIKVH
jgi:hypothetical protein